MRSGLGIAGVLRTFDDLPQAAVPVELVPEAAGEKVAVTVLKMTLFVEEFDLAKLVREVEATVQPLVAKNSNKLEVECTSDLGSMRADQTKVRQTLFNLLSNASKFTEKGT